jgi:hypothetical protein
MYCTAVTFVGHVAHQDFFQNAAHLNFFATVYIKMLKVKFLLVVKSIEK